MMHGRRNRRVCFPLLGIALAGSVAAADGGFQAGVVLVRVKPGSSEDSYLMLKIEGTHLKAGGRGARMPLGGPVLDEASIAVIRAWIVAGAPES